VLAQLTIATKSNEIPAFAPLLDQVQAMLGSVAGVVIVADALHAQVGHAHNVTARGAHLMVTVKANQPTLLHRLQTLPWAQVSVGYRTHDRGHGRRETRTLKAVTVDTPGGLGFPHAAQAVRITRTRTITGKTTRETFDWEESGPIPIADNGDHTYVLDGHHRLAAAKLAGLEEVPIQDVTGQLANGGFKGYADMDDVLRSAQSFMGNRVNPCNLG
jgi:hypothetical protein